MKPREAALSLLKYAVSVTGLIVLTMLFAGAANQACWAQAGLEEAIQLKQTHYFLGDNVVTAAKDAVRIENTGRFRFILVSKAPDWRVTVYRNDDKTYFSEDLKEFEDTALTSEFLMSHRPRFEKDKVFRKTPMQIDGFTVLRMTNPVQAHKYMPLKPGSAQQVELVIYSAYKMTTFGGLPIEQTGRSSGKDFISGEGKDRPRVYLSTSAIKTVKVPPEFFQPPKGFKKAASLREVVAGNDTRAESKDAQELFETGRDKSSK
jgi:hypothetical protein